MTEKNCWVPPVPTPSREGTYVATDADLDAIAAERVTQPVPVETTAELLRRLTKERNEARAQAESQLNLAAFWKRSCRSAMARSTERRIERDALAAKLARVEAVDTKGLDRDGLIRALAAALADPAAERPTPATTEKCICRPAWPGVAGRLVHAECPVHAAPATTEAKSCCGHIHTPEGCTGPPTPSDVWAGVSPSGCDCDEDES